jgi:hypothetical protein
MKKSDRIPLNSTVETQDPVTGEFRTQPQTRSVEDEIKRLRNAGMDELASRYENSCTDYVPASKAPLEVNPLAPKGPPAVTA